MSNPHFKKAGLLTIVAAMLLPLLGGGVAANDLPHHGGCTDNCPGPPPAPRTCGVREDKILPNEFTSWTKFRADVYCHYDFMEIMYGWRTASSMTDDAGCTPTTVVDSKVFVDNNGDGKLDINSVQDPIKIDLPATAFAYYVVCMKAQFVTFWETETSWFWSDEEWSPVSYFHFGVDKVKPVFTETFPMGTTQDLLTPVRAFYNDRDNGLDIPLATTVDTQTVQLTVDLHEVTQMNVADEYRDCNGTVGCPVQVTTDLVQYDPPIPWKPGAHGVEAIVSDTSKPCQEGGCPEFVWNGGYASPPWNMVTWAFTVEVPE